MQVDAALQQSFSRTGKEIAGGPDITLCLLDALLVTILDSGSPSTANPYLTALFQKAAPAKLRSVPDTSRMKVRSSRTRQSSLVSFEFAGCALRQNAVPLQERLAAQIVESLAAGSSNCLQRYLEAAVLLNSAVDAGALLAAKDLACLGRCIVATVSAVSRSSKLTPIAVSNLLAALECGAFASALLAQTGLESGLGKQGSVTASHPRSPRGESALETLPEHSAELLGLAAALLSLPGGQDAGTAVLGGLLGTNRQRTESKARIS